jgi:organic hydroperoxide reductase OsmC/OhrA
MLGTFARVLADNKIKVRTSEDQYWVDVEGDIENVNNALKITEIRVIFHLKAPKELHNEIKAAFSSYLTLCPAAQSVIGCIAIKDTLVFEKDL